MDGDLVVRTNEIDADDGVRLVVDLYGERGGTTPLLCLAGLTRNARDFTDLGTRLGAQRLVVAADVRGRGRSGYDPTRQSYSLPTYQRDVLSVCDDLGLDRVVLLGTSMGGRVAMGTAAGSPERVAGLVLNDIGPTVEEPGLVRISSYAGKLEPVADWAAAVAQARLLGEEQTPGLSDDEWVREARQRYGTNADGLLAPDHDPGIIDGPVPTEDPWEVFDALGDLPVLVLRGATSDILSAATVEEMRARHPGLVSVDVPGRGHAPLLDEPEAVAALDSFLAEVDRRR